MLCRRAMFEDHGEIVQLSLESEYTKQFKSYFYHNKYIYAAGLIYVIVDNGVKGFICLNNQRIPCIDFISISEEHRKKDLGRLLVNSVGEDRMYTKVKKDNYGALKFFKNLKFKDSGLMEDDLKILEYSK